MRPGARSAHCWRNGNDRRPEGEPVRRRLVREDLIVNAVRPAPIESMRPAAPWPRVKLSKVCDFIYGFPFDSSSFNTEGNGSKLIRIRDVVPGDSSTFTTQKAPAQYAVHDGDLLVGMDGDFNVARWRGGDAVLNQRVCMFRPNEHILLSGFLYYSLGHILSEIWEKKGFSTVKHLLNKDLQAVFLPLPPLSIQRDIVARLDADLARANRLRERFLALAESASARFRAILSETFEQGENGDSWPRVNFDKVCEVVSPRGHQVPQSAIRSAGQWPVVSQSEEAIEGYTSEVPPIESTPIILFGDHTCCVKLVEQPFVVGADGTKLLHPTGVDATYFYWFCRRAASCLADGRYRRHFADLMELSLPLPPIPVQRSVVARLDAARADCRRIEELARKGAEGCAALRAALLKEAFE